MRIFIQVNNISTASILKSLQENHIGAIICNSKYELRVRHVFQTVFFYIFLSRHQVGLIKLIL